MLKNLFYRFRWHILLASVLSTLSAVLGIQMLSIISDIIGNMGTPGFTPAYSFFSFSLIVLGIVSFGIFSQYVLLKLGTTVVYKVQKTILERVLGTDYQILERNGRHKIMAAMRDDVAAISKGINVLPNFIYSSVSVLLCLAYMVYTAWQLFILVAVVIIILSLSTQLILKYAFSHQKSLRDDYDLFFSNLNALTNGGKELHVSHRRTNHFYNLVMLPLFTSIRVKTVKISAAFIGLDSFAGTIVMFLIGSIVYVTLNFFPDFDAQVVVTFTLVILYMVEPLTTVIEVADEVNLVRVSLDKIARLELAESSVFLSSIDNPPSVDLRWEKIQLKNVTFEHYKESESDTYQFKLGPISADFGLSQKLSIEQYKSSISVVFSDTFVFPHVLDSHGAVVSDETIKEHLERLDLDKKVDIKNGSFVSKKLSTGQTKRLALLQSFEDDAHIYIYDEWAADQDPTFKEHFYLNILPELKRRGKIVIVITHDDQYFDSADQLLKLVNGELVDIA